MKKVMMALGAMLCFASVAFAKDDVDAERRAVAEELAIVMRAKDVIEKLAVAIDEQIKHAFPMFTSIAEFSKTADKITELLKEEISWEKVKDDYIDLHAKMFTVDEMKACIAFYKTPAGQVWLDKQFELTMQGAEIGQKAAMRIRPKLQELIKETEVP